MRLVRKVSWNFPGLETEQSIDEHKIIVLKFMNDKRALCVKYEQDIVGVLIYSRKRNMICCLAVDPAYRKNGTGAAAAQRAIISEKPCGSYKRKWREWRMRNSRLLPYETIVQAGSGQHRIAALPQPHTICRPCKRTDRPRYRGLYNPNAAYRTFQVSF